MGENIRDALVLLPGFGAAQREERCYEEKIRKAEELVSLDWLIRCLKRVDYAIYGLNKNLNVNLLVSSFFANFKEWEYA